MECDLCKNRIDIDKDRYVHIEDWRGEKKEKEIWCHLPCFQKAMLEDQKKMLKQSKQLIAQAGNIFNRILPPTQEVYEIK